ncbi:ABC transporter ATP-binding protein/permease [Microbacterium sp. M28]|uniref:ABC transporter ATP-binding protein n=1 Tax=Microbacterium sp. M28 TaxID=2962064 RepID=UPI0021F44592|nr:ABC transporter ATP-binding protein [Microbacterium sp. M28]UYO98165.1 ABC transporter ATP-binding protein/permease [Microbacterium sp. M28]
MKRIFRTFRDVLPYLPERARKFIWTYIFFSSSLAVLDVAALMLLAASLTAMVAGNDVNLPVIGQIPPSGYLWIILTVSLLIIIKSTLNILLQWVSTRRMATFELEIGDRLFAAYIQAPWTERLKRNTSQLVRLADVGIANVTAGFLLPFMTLPALLTTALAVLAVILVVQPITALVTIAYLGLISVLLYFVLSQRTVTAGRVNRDYSFRVASLMTDMVSALKEVTLRNKAGEVAAVVHETRKVTSRARANMSFISAVPKFVLDAALVGGFLLVGGAALVVGGPAHAVSAISLFAVAGFRLVPSLTSFQGLVNQMSANIPHVTSVINDIKLAEGYVARAEVIGHEPIVGNPRELILDNVSLTYPGATEPALRGISAVVPIGSTLGIVGASGAGKSSLIDLLLGLMEPTTGRISLGDQALTDVLASWRSRVGYVPQDVALFDGTIAQNVALSWGEDADEQRVRDALRRAHLLEVVESRPEGIYEKVGDRGMRLSGGQRQRLGIARALYADPLVLVLDEATSALDTRTEADVTASIRELEGEITVISVAHRLSTIRDSDEVWFMRDGMVKSRGRFDEVIAAEPEFAHQAQLAGLL